MGNIVPQKIPDVITQELGNQLQEEVFSMMPTTLLELFYPLVLISYATSRRELDAPGTGPGMYYAFMIIKLLHEAGIPCFSGLHVLAGNNWEVFKLRMAGSKSRAVVLIVIQTEALYYSKPCLEEIYTALDCHLKILPLRFEENLPKKQNQWPVNKVGDNESTELMRLKVLEGFGKLNSMPARGTVFSDEHAIRQFPDKVKEIIQDAGEEIRTEYLHKVNKENDKPTATSTEHSTDLTQFPVEIVKWFEVLSLKPSTLFLILEYICNQQECVDMSELSELFSMPECKQAVIEMLPKVKRSKFKNIIQSESSSNQAAEETLFQPNQVEPSFSQEEQPKLSQGEEYVKYLSDYNLIDQVAELPEGDGLTLQIPLHAYTRSSNDEIVALLLKYHANVNVLDEYSRSALIISCEYDLNSYSMTEQEKILSTFRVLLKAPNINLNLQDVNGQTALMIATRMNNTAMVMDLVEAGADLNLKDMYNQTALFFAVDKAHSLVQYLVKGSDLEVKSSQNGCTVLMLASLSGSVIVVKQLLKAGADSYYRNHMVKQTAYEMAPDDFYGEQVKSAIFRFQNGQNDSDESDEQQSEDELSEDASFAS